MRGRLLLLALAILAIGAPIAVAATEASVVDSYRCDAAYDNYTGCAVIVNRVTSAATPSATPTTGRPLRFVAFEHAVQGGNMIAQRRIPANGQGDAIVGGFYFADGAAIYAYRQRDLDPNYQALVGFRLSSNDQLERCLENTYLDCKMSAQQETGRDSKHTFTITSRPLQVRIVNTLPVALERVDGPYWSSALRTAGADDAGVIAAGTGIGYSNALRAVSRTSAFAAIYKTARSTTDPTYNGDTVLINIKVKADGTHGGSACTPVHKLSSGQFNCDITFGGDGKGYLWAIVRVRPS